MHHPANKLIHETSPYLLQHAHNPVDWYPWGKEALDLAKKENKPILISIGYSACHWCHVMERESFEDPATAKLMNENFINIKIDREERPDLDHIYMDAVQAMTGSGGWPLNVFLTPDAKPFYGGTYYPPQRAFNRPSWQEILLGVAEAFRGKRDEIETQANNLTGHLQQANSFGLIKVEKEDIFSKEKVHETFQNLMQQADREWGGFGRAPKFPQTFSIIFLLRYHLMAKNEPALQQASQTIDKMTDGGIYDQLGGGFARYSTDTEWLVPHFEKMLYDNALLVSALSEAYQLTKKPRYREIIEQTLEFIQREMTHPDHGFYSALDADSEGREGKYYVWDYDEVSEMLKEDAPVFCSFFDITPGGNWEHHNILRRRMNEEKFCEENKITIDSLKKIILKGQTTLLAKRADRIRPGLDDKMILGWNALMNTALSGAFAATGEEKYRQRAIRNMEFLLEKFSKDGSGSMHHTWTKGEPKFPAFLDDYAYLVQALIHLQEITAESRFLLKAKEIAEYVIEKFSEAETGFFYYTPAGQEDVIIRKKEIYDGATPSGNAVMAENLYRLSLYFDLHAWRERATRMISSLNNAPVRYPTSFGAWAILLLELTAGTNEIAVVGENYQDLHRQILQTYIPHKIIMCTGQAGSFFPLLADKNTGGDGRAFIYLCRGYACQPPVAGIEDLLRQLNSAKSEI